MKIVHVYAHNLQIFVDAVKNTDCRLNASKDINYLINSLSNYNGRDVLGLVLFANPITKKCLKLVKKFDELFVFKQMPIIIVTDNAKEMYNNGYFHVRNSKVFLLESEDNTISDVDMASIFTTLLAFSDSMYDLSVCAPENRTSTVAIQSDKANKTMSDNLVKLLASLKERSL